MEDSAMEDSAMEDSAMEDSAMEPIGTASLQNTAAWLQRGMEDGLHFGAQVYACHGVRKGAPGSSRPRRIDLAVGERAAGLPMTADTLNIWLSATKPVTAVAWALLWQRGQVNLDDPVARYIPEFADHGKGGITLRHILTHTSGIRMLNLGWPEASWDEILTGICKRRPEPRWTPGDKAGYHMASSWFVLGEVVARIAREPFSEFVRREVLAPCGMEDSWIGMPTDRFEAYGDRVGQMWGTEKGQKLLRRWHEAPSVVGCSPGGNGRGPIRELGKFYEMLLRGGVTEGGRQLLSAQTVTALTSAHRVGLRDQTFKQKLDWGLGFIIDSKHYGEELVAYGYGAHASRSTFGHSGFQSSVAMADPKHDLVIAAVVNGQPGEPTHTERFKVLTEAIYQDLGLAGGP